MSEEIRDLFRAAAASIPAPARAPGSVVGAGRRRLWCRRLLSSAAGLVVIAAVAGSIAQLGHRRDASPVAPGDRLRVVARVALQAPYDLAPDFPRDIAFGFGYVWALHARDGTLQRIDPATNRVDRVIDLAGEAGDPSGFWDVEAGAGRLWVTNPSGGHVLSIDPASGEVLGRVRGLDHPLASHVAAGAVWIISGGGSEPEALYRVDPVTLEVTGSLGTGTDCCLSGIVELGGYLWVSYSDVPDRPRVDASDPKDRVFDLFMEVRKIDPRDVSFVGSIPLEGDSYSPGDTVLGGLATDGTNLWVARPEAGFVDRIDPATGRVDSIDLGGAVRPDALTAFEGKMWVWDLGGSGLVAVDPASLEVGTPSPVTVGGDHPVVGAGSLWTPASTDLEDGDAVLRIDSEVPPEAVETGSPVETLAPEPSGAEVVEEMTEQEQAEVFAFRALAETGLMDPFSARSYNFTSADDTSRTGDGWRIGFAASDCEPRLRDRGYAFTCRGLSGEDPELGNALTDTFVTVARNGARWYVTEVEGNMPSRDRRTLVGYSLPEHDGPSYWEFPAAGTWPGTEGPTFELVALWVGPYPTKAPGSVCEVRPLGADGRPTGDTRRFYQEPPKRPFDRAGWVMSFGLPADRAADVTVRCNQHAR